MYSSTNVNTAVQTDPMRILLLYHCKANTGYAIETLEKVFWSVALRLAKTEDKVFLCYTSFENGEPNYVPTGFNNLIEFDFRNRDRASIECFQRYLSDNRIDLIFGFDQPPDAPYYKAARKAGVRTIVSYWGAPMSSLNSGLKLFLKKQQLRLFRHGPDFYIFESRAMQDSAYKGRGVPKEKTGVCYMGVDTEKFRPDPVDCYYAHDRLGIPRNQKLIFYSGHFEPRKGIAVIAQAANIVTAKQKDVTFVLFGNKPGEEAPYAHQLNSSAKSKVVFGGYRSDLNRIHRSCYAGVIASTGWDSFTVSALEIQSSGLPLLVSDLQGLRETIKDRETGYLFSAGKHNLLVESLLRLINYPKKRDQMAISARRWVEENFTTTIQVNELEKFIRETTAGFF